MTVTSSRFHYFCNRCKKVLWRVRKFLVNIVLLPSRLSERYIRPRILRRNVRHVSGPHTVDYGLDEVIALCVVRNGARHVRSFLEHHFCLGVRHVVFLDNDSTDETVRIAAEYSQVTVLQTKLPYRTYENVMKRYLVHHYAQNRWSLFVDIDERFDYPCSDMLPMSSLLAYLKKHSYTAVVAQMLDLFPNALPNGIPSESNNLTEELCTYYDISNIEKTDYPYGTLSNTRVKMHWGGIRGSMFGTRNGLTKAALIFLDGKLEPFVVWHHVRHARIADFTCLLRHYPFAGPFYEKVADAVETGRYGRGTSREYKKYWEVLNQNTNLTLSSGTAHKLEGMDSLIAQGFLVISESYQEWTNTYVENMSP